MALLLDIIAATFGAMAGILALAVGGFAGVWLGSYFLARRPNTSRRRTLMRTASLVAALLYVLGSIAASALFAVNQFQGDWDWWLQAVLLPQFIVLTLVDVVIGFGFTVALRQ